MTEFSADRRRFVCTAHEWLQKTMNPPTCVCDRCGFTTPMQAIGAVGQLCRPRYEPVSWLPLALQPRPAA